MEAILTNKAAKTPARNAGTSRNSSHKEEGISRNVHDVLQF